MWQGPIRSGAPNAVSGHWRDGRPSSASYTWSDSLERFEYETLPSQKPAVQVSLIGFGSGKSDAMQVITTARQILDQTPYIVDTMSGGGVAFLDCNDDGKLDIAVVRDSSIERNLAGGDLMVTLYRQDSAGKKDPLH